ncbi:beta-glucosidase [Candidatus Gracilibacteria bacterium]|nr:beta-glucosidase [Candidatus Gracilibacteria bacterium]
MNTCETFPADFCWGAATAAYQIEGAWNSDGRGESIWDRFSHTPGKVANGDTGDIACDHYHRWPEDVALMAQLGLHAYRFSISWPRIFPSGGGQPNHRGLDFYRRLIDALCEHKIAPVATLYHWDLPQALQERGGWANRDTAYRFAEYADLLFQHFGAQVTHWHTLNEPAIVSYIGHLHGSKAPGTRRFWQLGHVIHHLLLAHGLAVQAYRSHRSHRSSRLSPGIGIVLNLRIGHPDSADPRDKQALDRIDTLWNRMFLDPLFRGYYPEEALRFLRQRGVCVRPSPGDLEIIAAPIDLLGLNVYTRSIVAAARDPLLGVRFIPPRAPKTAMGWEIYPPALYETLQLAAAYTDLPLYIAENGAAFNDTPTATGAIDDHDRIAFLQAYLAEAQRAIDDGIRLKGYFLWSLLDNFEWEEGYQRRFGIVHVDFPSGTRTLKRSAHWYRDLIARNGVLR